MILSAMLALTLVAGSEPEVVYRCWVDLGPFEGVRRASVHLEQDRVRNPVRHTLFIETDDFSGIWALASARVDGMRHLDFRLRLPEATPAPIWIAVTADGRAFWSGPAQQSGSATVERGGRAVQLPIVALRGGPIGDFPSIFGVGRLGISVSDAAGTRILERRVRLPDWRRIERRASRGVREVDRLAHGAQCLPATVS